MRPLETHFSTIRSYQQYHQAVEEHLKLAAEQVRRGILPYEFPEELVNGDHRRQTTYVHPFFTFDMKEGIVHTQGEDRPVTQAEATLLAILAARENRVVTYADLASNEFGVRYYGVPDYIKTHVHNLRKKVEPDPQTPQVIVTVIQRGYKLINPDAKEDVHTNDNGDVSSSCDGEDIWHFDGLNDPAITVYEQASKQVEDRVFQLPNCTYYPEQGIIVINGKEVQLTGIENRLLDLFSQNQNRNLLIGKIESFVWGPAYENERTSATAKTHIHHLNKKLAQAAIGERRIRIMGIPGIGYKLVTSHSMDAQEIIQETSK